MRDVEALDAVRAARAAGPAGRGRGPALPRADLARLPRSTTRRSTWAGSRPRSTRRSGPRSTAYRGVVTPARRRASGGAAAGALRREPRVDRWIFSTDGVGFPVPVDDTTIAVPEAKRWVVSGDVQAPGDVRHRRRASSRTPTDRRVRGPARAAARDRRPRPLPERLRRDGGLNPGRPCAIRAARAGTRGLAQEAPEDLPPALRAGSSPRRSDEQVLLDAAAQQDAVPDREAGHHALQVGLPVARAGARGLARALARPGSRGPGSGSAAEPRGSASRRGQDQHQRLRAARRRQPGHERRHLVRAHVVEDVPREQGVEALVRREGQQPLESAPMASGCRFSTDSARERPMEVGDPHAARQRREKLDVARERRPEVEHGVARLGPQAVEERLQRLRAMARRTAARSAGARDPENHATAGSGVRGGRRASALRAGRGSVPRPRAGAAARGPALRPATPSRRSPGSSSRPRGPPGAR